jgi:putative heme transporter
MSATVTTPAGPRRLTPATRRVLRVATGAVVAAAVVVGIVVVLPTVEAAGAALVGADIWFVVAAVGLEAIALLAFAVLHRRLLTAASVRVSLTEVTLATMAANALHLTVPGGAALASAYTFKRRRAWGASAPAATWTMVAGGVAASLALAAIALGSALVVGGRPTSLPLLVAQIAGVAALGVGVVLIARRPGVLVGVGTWGLRLVNRVRGRDRDAGVDELAEQIAALQLIDLRGSGRAVVSTAALANWIFDIACLAACCAAVGAEGMTLALVLVAYAAATAASSAAFLPGGLGLVDGALLAALVAGGVPSHPALAAVLLYRLISFVVVAAVGWVAWFVIHARETPSAAAVDSVGEALPPTGGAAPLDEHDDALSSRGFRRPR